VRLPRRLRGAHGGRGGEGRGEEEGLLTWRWDNGIALPFFATPLPFLLLLRVYMALQHRHVHGLALPARLWSHWGCVFSGASLVGGAGQTGLGGTALPSLAIPNPTSILSAR
jgi:hypothetical protein